MIALIHGPLWRMLLFIGWIFFMVAVAGPSLRHLAWLNGEIALFVGPALMFAGLILRHRSTSHRARAPRATDNPGGQPGRRH
jgi:hypothetical protein